MTKRKRNDASRVVGRHHRVSQAKTIRARELRKGATEAEKKLWNYLRRKQLEGLRFRRQVPVGPWIVDFYCHAASLIVELDGPIHETMSERDHARTRWLEAHGFTVIRFTNEQVFHSLKDVLARIKEHGLKELESSP